MSDQSDNFRQADGRFAKGNPGGPGRPRGRDPVTELDLLAAEAGPTLIELALEAAKGGNLKVMEMLFDRIWPVRRGRPVQIDAEVHGFPDLVPAGAAVTHAVFNGEMTPEEGVATGRVLVAHEKMLKTVELEQRLRVLEEEEDLKDEQRRKWGQ